MCLLMCRSELARVRTVNAHTLKNCTGHVVMRSKASNGNMAQVLKHLTMDHRQDVPCSARSTAVRNTNVVALHSRCSGCTMATRSDPNAIDPKEVVVALSG